LLDNYGVNPTFNACDLIPFAGGTKEEADLQIGGQIILKREERIILKREEMMENSNPRDQQLE